LAFERTRRQTVLALLAWTPIAVIWLAGLVYVGAGLEQTVYQDERNVTKTQRLASAELFDPATQRFTPTGSMPASHYKLSTYAVEGGALLLSDALMEQPLPAQELAARFDAKSGTFRAVVGPMPRRSDPAQLAGGKLLFPSSAELDSAILFDFAKNELRASPPFVVGRCRREAAPFVGTSYDTPEDVALRAKNACLGGICSASAVTLADGRALALCGGDTQIYDPAANTWVEAAPAPTHRENALLRRLNNGKILVFGGYASRYVGRPVGDAHTTELYDPVTNTWQALSPAHGLLSEASVMLAGDRVVARGSEGLESFANGAWVRTLAGEVYCGLSACVFLRSGALLIAGGRNETGIPEPAQLLPLDGTAWQPSAVPNVQRSEASLVTLNDGRALFSGGEETIVLSPLERWRSTVTLSLFGLLWLGGGVAAARLPPERFRPPLRWLVLVLAFLALLGGGLYVWLMWELRGFIKG